MDADAEGFVFGFAEYGVGEMRGWRISDEGGGLAVLGKVRGGTMMDGG